MRIVRLNKKKQYVVKKTISMKPFDQESLLDQLWPILMETMIRGGLYRLVFDATEVQAINELLGKVNRNIVRDRGHGHVDAGAELVFGLLLKEFMHCEVTAIPADLNANQHIADVTEWAMAIQ